MTHEDERPKTSRTDPTNSNDSNTDRVTFNLQGALSVGDHSHFHHHAFRNRSENQDAPVRFKDTRANEQAEKLREKLREKQLTGAAQNIPETFLIPCQGQCRFEDSAGDSAGKEESSSEDAADEVLQRFLSSVSSFTIGSVTSDNAVLMWDELDIEGCVYTVVLTQGRVETLIEDVETPHVLTKLIPGSQYAVSVVAKLGSICGDATEPVSFDTLPTEPSQPLQPRPAGSTKSTVQVKWNATSANGSPVSHYILYWDQGAGDWRELERCSERQHKVTGLTPGTEYHFAVSAVNEIGESLRSDAGSCWTGVGTPNPPTCIYLGQASETGLIICWSPPGDTGGAELLGYTVEQETEYGFIVIYNGEVQECHVTELARSTQYRFRVFSRNVAGQSKSSAVVTFTTRAGLPPSPSNVRVEGRERSDAALIAWEAPTLEGDQQILRYNLKLSAVKDTTDGYNGCVKEFHSTYEKRLLIDGLLPGTLYRTLVTVVTAGGEGPPSTPFIFKTRAVCPSAPAPPSLRTKASPYAFNLQWNPPSFSGGSKTTKYTLEMYKDDWVQIYTGPETILLVPALLPGTTYKFRVRCNNVAGQSLYSNTVPFTTAPAPPHPPEPPLLVSKGPYAASISWQESVTNGAPITSFSVELCLLGGAFQEIYNGPGLSCVTRRLQPGCTYYCVVKASSAVGQSIPSEATVYNSPPAPPGVPADIILEDSTDSTITIAWDAAVSSSSDILHYNVCFNGSITKCLEETFTAEGLESEKSYKVRVQAVNSVGSGQFSSVKVVTTGTPRPPPLSSPLQLLSRGHNFLKIGWNTSKLVKLYQVQRSSSNLDDFVVVLEGNKNQVKIGKLAPDTQYTVRVCGVNSAGLGPWLEETFTTESIPPKTITKVSRSIKDTSVSVTWQIKDKLLDNEVFQVFQTFESEIFSQVYEGLDDTYTTNLSPDTHSSFKIRVKRDTALQPLFGPFSQTLFVKMKPLQALPEEKVREELSRNGPENLEVVSEDRYIIVVILLALCLPAVLAIFYLVSF